MIFCCLVKTGRRDALTWIHAGWLGAVAPIGGTLMIVGWGLLTFAFVVTAAILALTTRNGRGLPGILGRQELRDSRERSPRGRDEITRSGDARRG